MYARACRTSFSLAASGLWRSAGRRELLGLGSKHTYSSKHVGSLLPRSAIRGVVYLSDQNCFHSRHARQVHQNSNEEAVRFADPDEDAKTAERLLNSLGDPPEESGDRHDERQARIMTQALEHAEAAAARGSPRGKTLLGYILRDGLGVEKDGERARECFSFAAHAGDPYAQLALGHMLLFSVTDLPEYLQTSSDEAETAVSPENEIVVDIDESGVPMARYKMGSQDALKAESPAELVRKVRKARKNAGFADEQALEYEEYKQRKRREANEALRREAVCWLRKASDQGNDEAAVALASVIVHDDPKEALELYKRAASRSHLSSAHFNMGQLYYAGLGDVAQDQKLARKHFLLAAQLGDPSAQFFVGHLYRVGDIGVEVDHASSRQYIELAAAQHHAPALFYLALMHRNGEGGLEVSRGSFRRYLEASANLGHPDALALMAEMYHKGTDGAITDHKRALDLFLRAGAAGDNDALCSAAAMYFHGIGVETDQHRAFLLYQDAAVRGSIPAMQNLGAMYYHGHGVPKSDVVAEQFFRLVDEMQSSEKEAGQEVMRSGVSRVQAKPRAMPHNGAEAEKLGGYFSTKTTD